MGKQRKQWETIFWGGSKITADGNCSHDIKICSLLGREAMTNLDSILKSRDITLPTKVLLVKAMVFPVVMYGCESWTIKKAECRRIDTFELWCWRRLLRVSWTARRSNQLILKEISPEYSLEGLILKLKLQYFGHLMQRTDSLERPWFWERLKVGGEGDDRGWDSWMASLTQRTWIWVGSGSWWWTGKPGVLQSMGLKKVRHNWATELNCATPKGDPFFFFLIFWRCCAGCKILFLRPGKEPIPPAVGLWDLNHRTTRDFPRGGGKKSESVSFSATGSSVHGILQAGILEGVVILFCRGSSWPRDWTQVLSIAGGLYHLNHQGSPHRGST